MGADVLTGIVKLIPWAALIGLIGLIWKARIPMRKMSLDADASLRADLLKQLNEQEGAHKAEIASLRLVIEKLEERLETQRAAYEAKLDYERVTHAGEMASFRHKVNNLEQSLNMLLVLIETNPEKAQEAAKRTRELREKQETAEAAEKNAITAAKINASAPAPCPAPTPTP